VLKSTTDDLKQKTLQPYNAKIILFAIQTWVITNLTKTNGLLCNNQYLGNKYLETLFQRSINKTCRSKRNSFIIEDTMETASHFICKIVYKHNMTRSKVHAQRERGAGVD
jgi:hypothetical protein